MDDSTIFITGANGQLGRALKGRYPGAKSADIDELDISDADSVSGYDWSNMKVIINAAGYTNVDGAESPEGRVSAWQVNSVAVGNLAGAAIKHDIMLIHISTDYVFDGTHSPHNEEEPFSPLSVYGQSKAAGDIVASLVPKHYILRTSWVIGEGNNFVRTMLDLGQKGVSPTVVADQVGRPTFTSELVKAIDHLLTKQSTFGTYNVSNGGEPASWADITRTVFEIANFDLKVTDTTTTEYYADKEGIAPRPLQSTFDLAKIQSAGFTPTDWREDLTTFVKKELQTS
ncbi:MAG TPA: NAD(P)-dependent oxidoreductase [Candidatus Saccharimonadales bacterium]|nr:NAD(P)-dependent oxidoreductase [Candidatus Saccharimonadales bacterium]